MNPITTTVDLDIAEAESAVRAALTEQGFGVLTEIDVAATLRSKLGVDVPPLKILGACNPALAHQALNIDPSAALVLPCNVVLEASGSQTRISAVDPHDIMDNPDLTEMADEAATKLSAALGSLVAATN